MSEEGGGDDLPREAEDSGEEREGSDEDRSWPQVPVTRDDIRALPGAGRERSVGLRQFNNSMTIR